MFYSQIVVTLLFFYDAVDSTMAFLENLQNQICQFSHRSAQKNRRLNESRVGKKAELGSHNGKGAVYPKTTIQTLTDSSHLTEQIWQLLKAQRYYVHFLTILRFWYQVTAWAFSYLWTKCKILIRYRKEENDFSEAVHHTWVDPQRRYVHPLSAQRF